MNALHDCGNPCPKVSVIIPTYRHRDFILQALDSVFAQTMQDYEIIVINDGSPDDTKTVLSPLIDANRIRYVEQENQGQSKARNRGMELARGQYIAFLDDDDVYPKDKLDWQSDFLDKNPEVALIGGTLQTMDERGQLGLTGTYHPNITFESLFAENPFLSPGQTLVRANTVMEVGGLNTSIWGADDWDLWFQIVKKNKIVMQNRVALFYRLHRGNASKQTARLLMNCCLTLNLHLKEVKREQRLALRISAYRNLYSGLGSLLVSEAKKQLASGRLFQAARTLRGLLPLRLGFLGDSVLRKRLLSELFLFSLRHKLFCLVWWKGKITCMTIF